MAAEMRYGQLCAVHSIAICGGFSRAAEGLFLTQPAICDQLHKLEGEYGILLFNWHKTASHPNPADDKLLEITRRLFDTKAKIGV